MEIERKWRVEAVPPELLERPGEPIDQGYLAIAGDGSEVRLRRRGQRCFLTFKAGRGMVRRELEAELESAQFEALWPGTEGRRLEKVRRVVPLGCGRGLELKLELDVFGGRHTGLAIAEVEFPDEAAAHAFRPPAWFDAEVTDDDGYRNQRLALDGMPGAPREPPAG